MTDPTTVIGCVLNAYKSKGYGPASVCSVELTPGHAMLEGRWSLYGYAAGKESKELGPIDVVLFKERMREPSIVDDFCRVARCSPHFCYGLDEGYFGRPINRRFVPGTEADWEEFDRGVAAGRVLRLILLGLEGVPGAGFGGGNPGGKKSCYDSNIGKQGEVRTADVAGATPEGTETRRQAMSDTENTKSKKPSIERKRVEEILEAVVAANPDALDVEEKSGWTKVTSKTSGEKVYIQRNDEVREVHLSGWGKGFAGTVDPPKANGKVYAWLDMSAEDPYAGLRSVLEALATRPAPEKKAAAPKAPKAEKAAKADKSTSDDRVERIKARAKELEEQGKKTKADDVEVAPELLADSTLEVETVVEG